MSNTAFLCHRTTMDGTMILADQARATMELRCLSDTHYKRTMAKETQTAWTKWKKWWHNFFYDTEFFLEAMRKIIPVVLGVATVVVTVAIFVKAGGFNTAVALIAKNSDGAVIAVSVLTVLATVASAMLRYLGIRQSTTARWARLELRERDLERLKETQATHLKTIHTIQSIDEFWESKEALLKAVGDELEERFSAAALKKHRIRAGRLKWRRVEATAITARRRLEREIEALARRGNLNLVLGTTWTLIALGVLWYIVAFSPPWQKDEAVRFTAYFVVRLTAVILIETFAFFFLRLYRGSLTELKYYQNELTTLDGRAMALSAAIAAGDQDALRAAIIELSQTERNVVLKQGESTVEVERFRADQAANKELISAAAQVVAAARAQKTE